MSSYLRNKFLDFAGAFFPMAPGNMKSDFIGIHRSKLNGKSYSTRKFYVKNSDGSNAESVTATDNMDPRREGDTLASKAADANPSVVLNATAMVSEVSNAAQSDNTKELLCARLGEGGCMAPQSVGSTDKTSAEITHLKVLSMLHLDVIEQQQRQIQAFERESQRLRTENETLKCRLERMNRRTSLAGKTDQTSPVQKIGRPQKVLDSPVLKKKRRSELDPPVVPSPSKTPVRGLQEKASNAPLAVDNLSASISSVHSGASANSLEASATKRSQRRQEKGSTKKEEKKTSRQDSKESRDSRDEEKFQRTDVMYPCLSDLRVPEPDPDFPDDESMVMVPSWRVVSVHPGHSSDVPEDCDEKTFEQRHSRLEHDERKRKRWDIQRIRELREHERLVNKQKQREYAQWEHILTSFYPEDNDAEYIEMCDTIPVITFGVQVPAVKPSEFELPWFDAKQRERDEQTRMTRRRSSRR